MEQLLEKTQEYVDAYDFELAERFCAKALQMQPTHTGALELMASVLLETDRVEPALAVRARLRVLGLPTLTLLRAAGSCCCAASSSRPTPATASSSRSASFTVTTRHSRTSGKPS